MKIAVIDNYDSFVYNLIRYLEEESNSEVIVMRNNQIDYKLLDSCDAILLSPGPGIPDEAGDLKKIITRYQNEKPLLGICLGHQAIAEVFDNHLELCISPLHGESSIIEILEDQDLFRGVSKSLQVGRYHSWKVSDDLKLPLVKTAISAENEVMAFKHQSLPIHGIQFHPESILTPEGRKIMRNWIEIVTSNDAVGIKCL